MKIYIIILILLSLFVGIPVNEKGWWFLWSFEFYEIPYSIFEKPTIYILEYILLVLSHSSLIILLLIDNSKIFKPIIILAPAIFVLAYYLLLGSLAVIVLIPVIIMWTICLFKSRKMTAS